MKHTWIKTLAGVSAISMMAITATAEQTIRPSGRAVNDLQVRGRVQTQFGFVDAENDQGSGEYSTFEVRRARIGLRGNFDNNIRAQLEANLVPGSDLSMRSAFVEWRDYKPAYIKVGFDKPVTSIEENTSSANIITVERSLINGLVAAPGPMTGISLNGEVEMFYYGVGLYTDTQNRNKSNEESDYAFNAYAGINLDGLVGEGSKWKLQVTYQSSDDSSGAIGSKFDEVIVLGTEFSSGGFGLTAEYFLATDNTDNDLTGFYVTPSFYLSEKLQVVGRFEMADHDKSNGIRIGSRYGRNVDFLKVKETEEADGTVTKVDNQTGDEYQAIYLGLNYYINGDASKLMFGVEFAELDNTRAGKLETTTFYTAWRTLF